MARNERSPAAERFDARAGGVPSVGDPDLERERGVILASGLMAGGALGGVLGAALRLFPNFSEDLIRTPFYANDPISQSLSALGFIGVCLYVWFGALKKENE